MRPQPSDDAVMYNVEVTMKFYFEVEADDDMQAEEIATYAWQDNIYRGEVHKVKVEMKEEDEDE
jgi:hypothetical protein